MANKQDKLKARVLGQARAGTLSVDLAESLRVPLAQVNAALEELEREGKLTLARADKSGEILTVEKVNKEV